MRIGVDCRTLTRPQGGIATYLLSLLAAIRTLDRANSYTLFFDAPSPPRDLAGDPFYACVCLPMPFVRQVPGGNWAAPVWLNWVLAGRLHEHGIEKLFCPNFLAPVSSPIPAVITVHDLGAFDPVRDSLPAAYRMYARLMLRRSVERASDVIVPSQFTKARLLEHLPGCGGKLHVVPEGVDGAYHPPSDRAGLEFLRQALRLPKRFALYVGSLAPRKNVETLLKAFALAREEGLGSDFGLVLRSHRDAQARRVDRLVESLALTKRVFWVPALETERMAQLYGLADLVAFPSRYEGFGLPVLEAMACGAPVLSSNIGSLAEVAGDAAWLLPPDDAKSWGRAMVRLCQDSSLAEELRSRGLRRAALYRWEEAARQTVEVLEGVTGVGCA